MSKTNDDEMGSLSPFTKSPSARHTGRPTLKDSVDPTIRIVAAKNELRTKLKHLKSSKSKSSDDSTHDDNIMNKSIQQIK